MVNAKKIIASLMVGTMIAVAAPVGASLDSQSVYSVASAAKGGAKFSAPKPAPKAAPKTNAAAKGNTAGAAAAQQSSSRFGSIMRNVGLLAGGMFLGSLLANLFGMGGFMGDVLGLLANIFLFGAVFMLLRWAWNKFRGNSNSSYSGNSWQRPSEPVDVTPRENQRPVYQDISRIPSGDYDAKTTADRYRNR